MEDNLQEDMYPTRDDNGDVTSPPFTSQLENLYTMC
jgi:hypothetical protein